MQSDFNALPLRVRIALRDPSQDRGNEGKSSIPSFLIGLGVRGLISERNEPGHEDRCEQVVIGRPQRVIECSRAEGLICMSIKVVNEAKLLDVRRFGKLPGHESRPDRRPVTR
jgi:hypothetical protein